MTEPNENAPETGITNNPDAAKPTENVQASAPAPKPAPAKAAPRPAAKKPAAKKKGDDRRFFLVSWFGSWFAIAWWSFSLSMLGMVLGSVRFLFPNVLSEPPTSYRAGKVSDYGRDQVATQFKEQGFWIVRAMAPVGGGRSQEVLYALSTVCTHLGCNPNWLQADQKFKCPCHGSGFYINGINFEGPAPRPLERFAVSVAPDGTLIVDKSRKFQFERDEWKDTSSYIPVA